MKKTAFYLVLIGMIVVLSTFEFCKKKEGSSLSDLTTSSDTAGTFTDERDGQTYAYMKIGNQYWMAENLNYFTEKGSWIHNEALSDSIGRLYDWETACKLCPDGWHLPGNEEWTELIEYYRGIEVAGGRFKDPLSLGGFGALYTGCCNGNTFYHISDHTYWWTATEEDNENAWIIDINDEYEKVYRYFDPKSYGFPVRCVRDLIKQ